MERIRRLVLLVCSRVRYLGKRQQRHVEYTSRKVELCCVGSEGMANV